MAITNLAWVLPRPSKSKYLGSFPLHFEERLLDLLRISKTAKILHPFGGKAKYGIKVDINPETNPDIIGDAHNLHMFEDSSFDLVVLDPPYSDELSARIYGTGKLNFKKYTREAVRVLKEGGYLVMFHVIATPSIPDTVLVKRIFIEHRIWHRLRCVHIHKKDTSAWKGIRGQATLPLQLGDAHDDLSIVNNSLQSSAYSLR